MGRLLGEPVIDHRGAHLGTLEDLIVEMLTGEVQSAIVSDFHHRGGERLVSVPARLLRTTAKNGLFLDLGRNRFAQQEPLRSNLGSGVRLIWLMDREVHNFAGRHVGRLVDVVLDLNAQNVHHAILGFDRQVGEATEHAFAVPVQSLAVIAGDPPKLALDAAHEKLAGLIRSDPDASVPMQGPRYLGTVDRSYRMRTPDTPQAVGATR